MSNYRLVFKGTPTGAAGPGVASGEISNVTPIVDGRALIDFTMEAGDVTSNDAVAGDIVILTVGTKFIYGVFNGWLPATAGQGSFIVTYDNDMYYSDIETMTQFAISVSGYGLYQSIEDSVDSYRITYDFAHATYSKRMLTYTTSIEYKLTIDDKRRFLVGDMFNALASDDLFFVDTCKAQGDIAYKISLTQDSIEAYNNKFRKTIQFKIAAP